MPSASSALSSSSSLSSPPPQQPQPAREHNGAQQCNRHMCTYACMIHGSRHMHAYPPTPPWCCRPLLHCPGPATPGVMHAWSSQLQRECGTRACCIHAAYHAEHVHKCVLQAADDCNACILSACTNTKKMGSARRNGCVHAHVHGVRMLPSLQQPRTFHCEC